MTDAPATADPRQYVFTRDPRPLGRFVITLLVLQVAADLVLLFATRRELQVTDELRSDLSSISQDDVDAANRLFGTTTLALLALVLVTAPAFIVWLRRTRTNVEQWQPIHQTLGRGWVIGAWFCPVFSLWFPYRLVRDVWDDTEQRERRPTRPLLLAWWLGYLIAIPLLLLVIRTGAEDLPTRDEYSGVLVSSVLILLTLLLAIGIVQRITAAQARRRAMTFAALRSAPRPADRSGDDSADRSAPAGAEDAAGDLAAEDGGGRAGQ